MIIKWTDITNGYSLDSINRYAESKSVYIIDEGVLNDGQAIAMRKNQTVGTDIIIIEITYFSDRSASGTTRVP